MDSRIPPVKPHGPTRVDDHEVVKSDAGPVSGGAEEKVLEVNGSAITQAGVVDKVKFKARRIPLEHGDRCRRLTSAVDATALGLGLC